MVLLREKKFIELLNDIGMYLEKYAAASTDRDVLKNKKDKKLLMYCTGGIRCEKASAYFKHKGFQNVFQLEGGIIEYAKQVKQLGLENNFIGKNFVFDNRMAEEVGKQVIANCHQCGNPFDIHTNCANDACHLLFIQ